MKRKERDDSSEDREDEEGGENEDEGEYEEGEGGLLNFLQRFESDSDVVRFFEHRDKDRRAYYTVYGEDARQVASRYYRTTSALRRVCHGALEAQTVSSALFVDIVRDLLLVVRRRVEVYDRRGSSWTLVRSGSPGNVDAFEEELFGGPAATHYHNPVTAAVHIVENGGSRTVGLALVDAVARKLQVAQFQEDAQYSALESALVQLGVREVLLTLDARTPGLDRLRRVLELVGVAVTERPRAEFQAKKAPVLLGSVLRGDPQQLHSVELAMDSAMAALSCILVHGEYSSSSSSSSANGKFPARAFQLVQVDFGSFFRLSSSTVQALNLVGGNSMKGGMGGNSGGGLFGVINHTKTAVGGRTLMRWLLQPLVDVAALESRQSLVQLLVDDVVLRQTLMDRALRHVPDVQRILGAMQRGGAALMHCVRLYHFVAKLECVHDLLLRYDGVHKDVLDSELTTRLAAKRSEFGPFSAMIVQMVDGSALSKGQFHVSSSFDPSLTELAQKMSRLERKMQAERASVQNNLGIGEKECLLESSQSLGHYLRVTKKHEAKARGRSREFRAVDNTRVQGFKFRTETLTRLNDEYRQLEKEYSSRESELIASILEVTGTYAEPLAEAAELLGTLDAFVSLAHAASALNYCRPKLLPKEARRLCIRDLRHAVLDRQLGSDFTPNDVEMDGESRLLTLVSGPNMAGKSTYIRSVGLAAILAQMGSFVPAREATMSVVDAVLCRVGASDSLVRGVSTFMAEMVETSALLNAASPYSLAIIDELGRGTSTTDGFGIACAICEYLVTGPKPRTLFATHFHELTLLAEERNDICNVHVSADVQDDLHITFLYRVRPGACSRSFGINIARMCHLPDSLLQRATMLAECLELGKPLPHIAEAPGECPSTR